MECQKAIWTRAFRPSTPRNLITHILTICYVKPTQRTALEQKRFDLRSLSPALRNLWLLLVVLVEYCSWNWTKCWYTGFSRMSIPFARYVKELSIHVHCTWLAESMNKWVKRMALRRGLSPLSGLICAIVNSVGQGNFIFVRKKVREFQKPHACPYPTDVVMY